MSTKSSTFIKAPGFNKYEAALKEMLFVNETVNLSINNNKNVSYSIVCYAQYSLRVNQMQGYATLGTLTTNLQVLFQHLY